MDRNSNADDVFGRLLFTDACDQQSTAPTGSTVSGVDIAYEDGAQDGTDQIQDSHSNSRCSDICGDCASHSSLPHRMEHAITNHPLVHEIIGQRDSHISSRTPEGDEITDRQQPGYRQLEQRDSDGLSRPPNGAQGSRQNPDTFWLPFFARRTTSLLFMAAFALMAAILEVLFTVSQRSSGLSPGIAFIRYSWSYGTTGILTFTAALWHRLDYETKVLASWLRAYPITTSKAALHVDYVNAWSLVIPFQALRNQDYEVVYSSTISLLLQVLIVLSTALFTLAPKNLVNEAEPVFLTSRFVDDPARLGNNDIFLPYDITLGTESSYGCSSSMMGKGSTHPEGCTNQFAYQTFYPASSSLEEVNATVDGLALGLACETGRVGKKVSMPQFYYSEGVYTLREEPIPYFEVEYQGCQATISWDIGAFYYRDDIRLENNPIFRDRVMVLRDIPGFARNRCDSTEPADHRLVFLTAEVEWHWNNQTIIHEDAGLEAVGFNMDATVSQAVALVCTPSLEQSRLDVSWSSAGVQGVSRHGGNRADMLKLIQPWDFIHFFFDKGYLDKFYVSKWESVGNTTPYLDINSQGVLRFCSREYRDF